MGVTDGAAPASDLARWWPPPAYRYHEGDNLNLSEFHSRDLRSLDVEFVRAGLNGGARLIGLGGGNLVLFPEDSLQFLQQLCSWHHTYLVLSDSLLRGAHPNRDDLGDHAWLLELEPVRMHAFVEDLHDALMEAYQNPESASLAFTVSEWRRIVAFE